MAMPPEIPHEAGRHLVMLFKSLSLAESEADLALDCGEWSPAARLKLIRLKSNLKSELADVEELAVRAARLDAGKKL